MIYIYINDLCDMMQPLMKQVDSLIPILMIQQHLFVAERQLKER